MKQEPLFDDGEYAKRLIDKVDIRVWLLCADGD
jgi:hypothetical protein